MTPAAQRAAAIFRRGTSDELRVATGPGAVTPNELLRPIFEVFPDSLTERDQWVLWRAENGTKRPYNAITGKLASSTCREDWAPFDVARAEYESHPGRYHGLGFVFTPEDGLTGIDLDDCILPDGSYKPWTQRILGCLESYSEVSPSGHGIKIWSRGKLAGNGIRRAVLKGGRLTTEQRHPDADGAIEMYDHGRYFTVTGHKIGILGVEDCQSEIDGLYEFLNQPDAARRASESRQCSPRTLPAIIEPGERHNMLMSMAGLLWSRGFGPTEIRATLNATNLERCKPPKSAKEIEDMVAYVQTKPQGTLPTLPREPPPAPGPSEAPVDDGGTAPALETDAEPPNLIYFLHNDHGNACRLIKYCGQNLRYCHALKKWLVWDGWRYAVDDTGQARRLAKETGLEFLKQAIKAGNEPAEKFAKASLDSKRITTMLSMAECEIFVKPDELDDDPFALNFLNGTVDLRTGKLRPHSQTDLITRLIHYEYRPGARCPRWREFLDQIMGGGPDASERDLECAERLTAYLQRAIGYSLTGTTCEKAVFIPFGGGNNGKSTMLNAIHQVALEYSVLIQVDTLMVRQESNNTQADLADLRGARFVQTSETEEGQRLAQGKLKRITQGMGSIKAVRKYENPIEFPETHHLWIDTNRKPVIRDADDRATFNRLHPIPFTVEIPPDQIDKSLPGKLLAEAEGILAWIVEGARLWFATGLNKPPEIDAAKEAWHSEMDQIGRFLGERCIVADACRVLAATLYAEYRNWAEATGEHLASSTAFGIKITDRRFEKSHSVRGTVYLGLGIRGKRNPDEGVAL
jgi:putative DNA primase/helicase